MRDIVLATSNKGKISELEELLAPLHCIPQAIFNVFPARETGLTFVENAIIKARHASIQAKKPAIADDSGLVVYALNGEPGIYSSRYAGGYANDKENVDKLLKNMENVPDEQRAAYFYCAIAVISHSTDPAPLIAVGKIDGFITRQPSGTGGFGYDPVFFIPHQESTMAQIPSRIKNTISHRAIALAKIKEQL